MEDSGCGNYEHGLGHEDENGVGCSNEEVWLSPEDAWL